MDITPDYLQNEVILILHHVEDCMKGITQEDLDYVKKGIGDIQEAAKRMESKLSTEQRSEVQKIMASWVRQNCKFASR